MACYTLSMKHIRKLIVLEWVLAVIGLLFQLGSVAWEPRKNGIAWGAESPSGIYPSNIIIGVLSILFYVSFCAALIAVTTIIDKRSKNK